jgi:hypothetical protein
VGVGWAGRWAGESDRYLLLLHDQTVTTVAITRAPPPLPSLGRGLLPVRGVEDGAGAEPPPTADSDAFGLGALGLVENLGAALLFVEITGGGSVDVVGRNVTHFLANRASLPGPPVFEWESVEKYPMAGVLAGGCMS